MDPPCEFIPEDEEYFWDYFLAAISYAIVSSHSVFFTIFSDLYYNGIDDELGDTYNFGSGLAKFCRMSLGAFAIGIFFGLGLLVLLHQLNRRLSGAENVVQVAATIGIAYLTYYTADVVWETSGVIATLTCGVIVRAFGYALINDMKLMANFWSLVRIMFGAFENRIR